MLETIWFAVWGILWTVYFVLDGFDLGLGTLLPFLGKSERDRRVIFNAQGPFWDGNEVWLVTAAGVTFAAFPKTYATMFSTLYTPFMLILFALILRGVSLEFRGKVDSPAWRKTWDTCMTVGSFLPALLFGVTFANIFRGIPFDGEGVFHGNLFTLLNPYGLAGGLLFVLLFVNHGALWLSIKGEGDLRERAIGTARKMWGVLLVTAAFFLVFSAFATSLYENLLRWPVLFIFPLLAVAGLVLNRYFLAAASYGKAWGASCFTIAGAVFFGISGLYPNLFPSSMDGAFSLTAYNSSSSPLTLKIMLGVMLVCIPAVNEAY